MVSGRTREVAGAEGGRPEVTEGEHADNDTDEGERREGAAVVGIFDLVGVKATEHCVDAANDTVGVACGGAYGPGRVAIRRCVGCQE